MSEQVKDKKGNIIEVGDEVTTKFRGGKREGEVGFSAGLCESLLMRGVG
jgi:hypothetical protein